MRWRLADVSNYVYSATVNKNQGSFQNWMNNVTEPWAYQDEACKYACVENVQRLKNVGDEHSIKSLKKLMQQRWRLF